MKHFAWNVSNLTHDSLYSNLTSYQNYFLKTAIQKFSHLFFLQKEAVKSKCDKIEILIDCNLSTR